MRGRRALLALAVALALGAAGAAAAASAPRPVERVASAPAPAVTSTGTPDSTVAARGPVLPPSAPVTLEVPAIGVSTSLLTLGLAPDGRVQVPPLESPDAGWYEHSPTPGELGPSVVLGHVDSARYGAGVFYDLAALLPGDAITVARADGRTAAFRVDRVVRYPKTDFPTSEVYGDLDHAGLRLITCGGPFDPEARSYRDNVVVYASAAA